MKKIVLAVAGAVLLAIPHSNAADLGPRRPVYKAPPPAMVPAPVFTWTGCYIGGNIGWGWGRDTVSIPNIAETAGVPPEEVAGLTIPTVTGNTNGVLGGGQVGCNYQFASNWVIGIEGGTFTGGPTTFNPGPITVSGINAVVKSSFAAWISSPRHKPILDCHTGALRQ